jgi:hypothetical protein
MSGSLELLCGEVSGARRQGEVKLRGGAVVPACVYQDEEQREWEQRRAERELQRRMHPR